MFSIRRICVLRKSDAQQLRREGPPTSYACGRSLTSNVGPHWETFMNRTACSVLLAFISSAAFAIEPDFYLAPQECKILVGSLVNGSLNVTPGSPPTYGCLRQGKNITCSVEYPSGAKAQGPSTETFHVLIDSPPLLYFTSKNGASFFSINTQQKTVVFTARITDTAYTGEKVCSGLYATAFELNLLGKQKGAGGK